MSIANKRKKKRKNWIIAIVAIAILTLIVLAYLKGKKKPKGEEVTIEEVEKRTIKETVSASGRVFPETEVNISSDVSGEVVELYVEEGDSVRIGQILAKIDPDSYVSAVERGRAGLNTTKSQLANSRSQIKSSKAQSEQIKAQLENARKVHTRNTKLRDDGVISEVEFESSLSSLQQLEATYRSSLASLNSAEQMANAAEFSVRSSEASLEELQTSLSRTTIKSPTIGVVSSLSIEKGERVVGTIQMAGTEMMRIANLNSMEVQVEVSENDILRVEMGDKADIEVDAYLDRKFKGVVTEIANSAANTSSTGSLNTDRVTNFIVKIRIDSESYQDLLVGTTRHPFRPGMSASVEIYTNESENILTIPIQSVTTREIEEDSLKTESGEEFREIVFVFDADTAKMIDVKTGIQDDEYIEILSGLEENDKIVTGPYSAISKRIEEGTALRIKEEAEKNKKKSKK
jgi:HlyD family secretion protein